MKKIVDLQCYVSVNGEEYYPTSYNSHWRYVDENAVGQQTEEITGIWSVACEWVKNHKIRNAEMGQTLFTNRPTLKIFYGDIHRDRVEYTQKEFRTIKFKWIAEPVETVYSITTLAKALPAEQFCEWLKDQGISAVNFNIGG